MSGYYEICEDGRDGLNLIFPLYSFMVLMVTLCHASVPIPRRKLREVLDSQSAASLRLYKEGAQTTYVLKVRRLPDQ